MADGFFEYDAFISYRHLERDIAIVDTLQKLAENYRSPCNGRYLKKGERIRRVFTDRSELPMSSDLGNDITQALSRSRFLIVIASEEYLQSRWCIEEVKTFLLFNNNSTERILFVHAGRDPVCIADILRTAGVKVDTNSFHEPFYISVCAPTIQASVEIIKTEYLRLLAALIGCGYDALSQRHKRARSQKILTITGIILLVGAIVGSVIAIQNRQRRQEQDYRNMDTSISTVYSLLREEDCTDALNGMVALYDQYGQRKAYAAYLAEQLESAAIQASYIPALSAFAREPLPFELCGISLSSDGKYVIVFDIDSTRDEGKMNLFLYDALLNKLSEHMLPVEDQAEALIQNNIFGQLNIDYLEADRTFVIEVTGSNTARSAGYQLVFSADGQFLQHRELPATEPGTVFDCEYSLHAYHLYSVTASGERKDLSVIQRASDFHDLASVSVTPDGRFVLVKEARGIYNDVLTVCDPEGKQENVRIDLGNHTIMDMQYRFDEKTQEAWFFFNTDFAGETERGMVVACRIADGELLNCEMYECNFVYGFLLSAKGLLYITDGPDIRVISTQNLCLPQLMAGAESEAVAHPDESDNDLAEEESVTVGNLTVTSCTRTHYSSPAFPSGGDIGISITDKAGSELVQFYRFGVWSPYFNQEDMVFGITDYDEPEKSEVFRFYDFYELMELLH